MESGTYSKSNIVIPSNSFCSYFSKINTDKSIIDLLRFVGMGGLLVSLGIFLNYLLSKGK